MENALRGRIERFAEPRGRRPIEERPGDEALLSRARRTARHPPPPKSLQSLQSRDFSFILTFVTSGMLLRGTSCRHGLHAASRWSARDSVSINGRTAAQPESSEGGDAARAGQIPSLKGRTSLPG